jgi:hypothetical protein
MKKCMILSFVCLFALSAAAAAAAGEASIESLLPASGKIAGWNRDGEMLRYEPENLWEYINGSAENFLTYDFVTVIAQDYIDTSGKGLKVEIYDHGVPLMAFGIYSQYRSPGVDFLEIGNEGFGDGYSIHFWKGRYYVKVNVFEESGETARAMEAFAWSVAGAIEQAGDVPVEVGCFPRDGLIEKSVTYVTEGVLGRGKLPPAFIGDYEIGEDKGQLFIFPLESDSAATAVFDWFTGEIGAEAAGTESAGKTGSGAGGKNPDGTPYLSAVGEDKYRGRMLIFAYERWMGIAAGFGKAHRFAHELAGKAVGNIALLHK